MVTPLPPGARYPEIFKSELSFRTKNKGWELFTDAIIRKVSAKESPVVFVLWGAYAQKKAALIDTSRHTIVQSVHPSPLSAKAGFFGSRPFSAINAALESASKPTIDWQIPDL